MDQLRGMAEFRCEIDVVIPALNCEANLRRCLERLQSQDIASRLSLHVVDGGSTDGTVEVAKEFGAKVHVIQGAYSDGLTGARNAGLLLGNAEFVWFLDSDNLLLSSSVASKLLKPMRRRDELQVTMPLIAPESEEATYSNWLSLHEQLIILHAMRRYGKPDRDCVIMENAAPGFSNAALIRRRALIDVGGYDTDTRLRRRLILQNKWRVGIVPDAHFAHRQTGSVREYRAKWHRRLRRYASMTNDDFSTYFHDYSGERQDFTHRFYCEAVGFLSAIASSVTQLALTRRAVWWWGLT